MKIRERKIKIKLKRKEGLVFINNKPWIIVSDRSRIVCFSRNRRYVCKIDVNFKKRNDWNSLYCQTRTEVTIYLKVSKKFHRFLPRLRYYGQEGNYFWAIYEYVPIVLCANMNTQQNKKYKGGIIKICRKFSEEISKLLPGYDLRDWHLDNVGINRKTKKPVIVDFGY